MIEFTYGTVSSQGFVNALQTLIRTPLPIKTAYNVKRIVDALESKKKDIRSEWISMLKGHVEFAGDIPLFGEDGGYKFLNEESKIALDEKEPAFSKQTFKIDRLPLHYSELKHVQLSAADAGHLEGIVVFEDVITEEDNVIPIRRQAQAPAPSPETPA